MEGTLNTRGSIEQWSIVHFSYTSAFILPGSSNTLILLTCKMGIGKKYILRGLLVHSRVNLWPGTGGSHL
jgi:hypothetical protein